MINIILVFYRRWFFIGSVHWLDQAPILAVLRRTGIKIMQVCVAALI